MGDNFQSMHFPSYHFSTREKHASKIEGGLEVAPAKNFSLKDP